MTTQNTQRASGSAKPKKRSVRSKGHKSKKTSARKKRKYRIRNWSDYDTALVNRGRLTLWLNEETLQHWRNQKRTGKRGKPCLYTGQAIACALRLGAVYHLPLRATEGLLASLVALSGANVPGDGCHRSESLRRGRVESTSARGFQAAHMAQSTPDRRPETGMIRAAATTTNSISDGEMLPVLLEQVPQTICQVSADGGYDRRTCYEAIAQRGAKDTMPKTRCHRAMGPGFGNTATASKTSWPVMRTCAASAREAALSGSVKAATIGVVWPRPRYFALKRSSGRCCEPGLTSPKTQE